ncbi:hypothetical protein [uncultured Mediterranean phage uvDeep-CGR2-KM21-C338]|nr:hypothetical protein [uncultured Mediterranean phage uvDeep-CGR2-KM21-C338]
MAYFVERHERGYGWGLPQEAHAYKNLADASRRADYLNSVQLDGNRAHLERWARVVDGNRRVWTTEMVEHGGPVATVCPHCGGEVA